MKTIKVELTDEEHDFLIQAKQKLSWHDFILKLKTYDDLASLFEWAWRYIEKSDNGNAGYFEALDAAGLTDQFHKYFGGEEAD